MNIYPEFIDQYNENIKQGKEFLKNYSICLTGLIKDGSSHISDKIYFFEELSQYTTKLEVLVYENDSKDETPNILKSWQNTNKIKFHILTEKLNATHKGHPSKDRDRTEAMASYRNKCLEYITNNINTDFVIVLDLDYKQISLDGLLNSFGWMSYYDGIDMMAGFSYQLHKNGLLTNYDSWAYRGTWWGDYQADQNFAYSFINWRPFIGSKPYKVNSAFGGSCIYKSHIFKEGKYTGEDCEHVTFHKSIRHRNLYVNPSQIMVV